MGVETPRFILALVPGAVPAFAKAVLDALDEDFVEAELATQAAAITAIEQRVRTLEAAVAGGRRISGARLSLLEHLLRAAVGEVPTAPDISDLERDLPFNLPVLAEALEELLSLDLIELRRNMNHPSGYAGAEFHAPAYLRVGPELLPEVPVLRDLWRVLFYLRAADGPRVPTVTLLEALRIPLPQANLLLAAMDSSELISAGGMAHAEWGWYAHVALLPGGRRLLRRDEVVPWDSAS